MNRALSPLPPHPASQKRWQCINKATPLLQIPHPVTLRLPALPRIARGAHNDRLLLLRLIHHRDLLVRKLRMQDRQRDTRRRPPWLVCGILVRVV